MSRTLIFERIEYLRDCCAWSLHHNRLLTTSQRICLSQERAACLRALEQGLGTRPESAYRIPENLEFKLKMINKLIRTSQWDRLQYENKYR